MKPRSRPHARSMATADAGRSKPKKKEKEKPKPKRKHKGKAHASMSAEDASLAYPISGFMVPATDSHGHSAKVWTRCPPSYKHQIATILNLHRYPWDTESDLVRVAVHRLLAYVAKELKNPEITSQQSMLNSLTVVCSKQMEYVHFQTVMEKCESTAIQLAAAGAEPEIRAYIQYIADQVERFESEYWRERYRSELLAKFKKYLKGGGK